MSAKGTQRITCLNAFKENLKKTYSSFLLISLAMSFMLFIYAPLELYFNNKNDFWYDFGRIAPVCLIMFAAAFIFSTAFLMLMLFIHPALYNISITIYTIVFLCCYIQGNFMIEYLPAFNGADIAWSSYSDQRIYTIILWAVVTVIALAAIKFFRINAFRKCVAYIGGFFSLMLLLSLTILCITTGGAQKKWDTLVTDRYLFEMSTDRNYIILMLDAVDGDEFSELLQTHPEYGEVLSDFTYYDDVMSAYPFTELCVPFLFSGEYFENQMPYDTYYLDAFTESPLFEELEKQGYRLGLYEPDAPLNSSEMYRFENIIDNHQSINSLWGMIKIQIKLVGIKYMPFDLKKYCTIEPGDIPRLRSYENGMTGIDFWDSNQTFYALLQENPITLTSDKCFRYIHIEGAHLPYRYDAEMNLLTDDSGSYTKNVEASMTITMKYLQYLKESNVYDNSAIIIMSDHGYNRFGYDLEEGRQHAILLAKGFDEKHDTLQISKAPIAHEDFLDMSIRLLNGSDGESLSDYNEGDYRERRYLFFHTYDHITEYIQTGKAADMDTLIPTGNEYNE